MSQRALFNSYNISDDMLNSRIQDFTIPNSRSLINPFRIDLIAKHIYIDSRILNENILFSKELYKAHISAFTHGKYIEQGQEGNKDSLQKYYDVFDDLIEKIKAGGFDPTISRVPIDTNGIILDGAHRTAVCSYFKLPIQVSKFNVSSPVYDYSFFKMRMMEPKYLDFIIHKYIQIMGKNLYTLCIWPKAFENKENIRLILEKNVALVYEKEISLTPRGAHSFVSQIYHHHDWVGTPKDKFMGARNKVNACFNDANPLTLFVLETDKSLNEIIQLKEEIRNSFAFGKHSLHITDNYKETEQISELLLNNNSVHHLNYGNPFNYYQGVQKILGFKDILLKNNYDVKEVLIDSSGSMEVYGLRKANDIDFISNQNIPAGEYYNKRSENELMKLYGKDIDNLRSPDSYFYFFGLRFLTLDKVLESKKNRGEKKDIVDTGILTKYLKSNSVSKYADIKFSFKRKMISCRRDLRIIIAAILRKLGLFDIIKYIMDRRQ